MKIGIHQPNFIPWIGYFYKISMTDLFVFLDDVQFSKNSFINRNKIVINKKDHWLTLPVKTAGKLGQLILETEIIEHSKSLNKILETIRISYARAPFFEEYFPKFKKIVESSNGNMCDLNIEILKSIIKYLEIEVEVIKASNLQNITGESADRLVSICKEIKADTYISGFGGMNYQEEEQFTKENIKLVVYDFKHPVYFQNTDMFIKNMSILDLIFNCGKNSIDYFNI